MKINLDSKKNGCIGCTACASTCPANAISMIKNSVGFAEPEIDASKCVMCGKCVDICPLENLGEKFMPKEQFMCQHTDSEKLFNSSSGGAFVGIAEQILSMGGVVYGAVYDDDFKGAHHSSTDEKSLRSLQKSKYVASDLKNTFNEIKKLSKTDRKVLFVGTPCQCAGLRKLIGDAPNVYIADFICGGSPAPKAFTDYINYIERKNKSTVKQLEFRGKEHGWKDSYLLLLLSNGKKIERKYYYDPYFAMFSAVHLSTKEECDTCEFRQRHSADLTMADFWGYRSAGIQSDDRGLSLVSINTDKGKELYNLFTEKTETPLTQAQIAYAYAEFNVPEERKQRKKAFLADLSQNDFSEIASQYVKTDKISVFISRVKSILKI